MIRKQKFRTTFWDSLEMFPSVAVTRDYAMSLDVQSHLWSSGRTGAGCVSRNSSEGWEWIHVQLLGRWEFETWSKLCVRMSCLCLTGFWLNPAGPSLARAHTHALCNSV